MNYKYSFLGTALILASMASTAEPVARSLALDAAQSYREQARYPASSHPVRDALDPILSGREVGKQILPGPNGDGPLLAVWSSSISYEPGEKLALYAELRNEAPKPPSLANLLDKTLLDERHPAASSITAKLVGEDSGPLGEVTYRDDGKGADKIKGDGIYSASLTLPPARAPRLGHAESVAVHVQAITAKGEPRGALGGFLYSNPGARLTGRYKDTMRDGSMVLSAEVEVLTPGRYHLAATLADSAVAGIADRPMAWAQNASVMQTGKQWMELSYYGLIFRDMAASGPMTVHAITLTSALDMPNAMSSVQRDVYRMAAHPLADFISQPFGDAGLSLAAERLESAEAR